MVDLVVGEWYKYRNSRMLLCPYLISLINNTHDRRNEIVFFTRLNYNVAELTYSFDSFTTYSEYHKSLYKADILKPPTYILAKLELISNRRDEEDVEHYFGAYSNEGIKKLWES